VIGFVPQNAILLKTPEAAISCAAVVPTLTDDYAPTDALLLAD